MTENQEKHRAARNRTMILTEEERQLYKQQLITLSQPATTEQILNKTIQQNLFEAMDKLPDQFVDLMFIDPPYNLTKSFNGKTFNKMSSDAYTEWLDSWFSQLIRILKPHASVYKIGRAHV